MPFYRFMIHGVDPELPVGDHGFFTTRHAWGSNQDVAAAKVLRRLDREFTTGVSAHIWKSSSPIMTIEDAWPIKLHQIFAAPNRGSTFYRP